MPVAKEADLCKSASTPVQRQSSSHACYRGCCGTNPCTVGCAAGWLEPTSFDTAQYGAFSDQQCSTGLFYSCNFTSPPFWGCCSSNPCATTGGCPSSALVGAFLTTNAALAEPFLSLNSTWESSGAGTTNTTTPSAASSSKSHTGAIAGGVVGGIAGLAIILCALLWLHRRRKLKATTAAIEPVEEGNKPPIQELSHDASTAVGLKELPGRLQDYQFSL